LHYCVHRSTVDFHINNTDNRSLYYLFCSYSRIATFFFRPWWESTICMPARTQQFGNLELAPELCFFLLPTSFLFTPWILLRTYSEFQNHRHILYTYIWSNSDIHTDKYSIGIVCVRTDNHESLRIRRNKKTKTVCRGVVSGLGETYNIIIMYNIRVFYDFYYHYFTFFPSKNDRIQSQHSTSSGRTLKRREKSIYHQLCAVSHGWRQCFFVIKYSDVLQILLLRSTLTVPNVYFIIL